MIQAYKNYYPTIHKDAFIHETAVIIGEVFIDEGSSIWPHAVLRGDMGMIKVGKNTSIQDGSVLHATKGFSETIIGDNITIGHRVILHGCSVANNCLIGMGSIILDNAIINEWSFIGASSLILSNKTMPSYSFIHGTPAQVIRAIADKEKQIIAMSSLSYQQLANDYKNHIIKA